MAVRPITLSEIYQIARNSYDDIWAIAKAYGRDVKIYLHWTAGYYDQFFYDPKTGKMDYHIAIDGEGNIFTDCDDFSEVRNHTWRRNSGSIGITLNAAVGASPNPAIGLGKCAPTAAQIESMIVSELLAISFSYPLKFNRINKAGDPELHKALNRAASVSTTELVKKYITIDRAAKKPGMKISDHAYTVEDLRNDTLLNAKEKETLEYYYSVYRKNPPETDSGDSKDSQSYVSLMSNDSDLMSTPNFRNENQKNSVHNWEGQYNPQDLETRIKSLVNKAYDEFNKSSRRGTLPESLEKEIEFLRSKPKINWRKKLSDLIGSITVPFRKSPARLNKKYPERTDLSGRLPKHKTRVVCILDTSGSMSDSDYTYCLSEVLNVSSANETEVTVIECDTKVSSVYVLDGAKRIKKVTRSSCGGTCFSPAIQYVNENNYRDAVCIYFTDGYGEEEIPKPRVQKMMWVVLDNVENLSVKEPYGPVCSLVDDEKYKSMKGV